MARLIADFERFLVREDRSPATVRSYDWALKDFSGFLRSRGLFALEQVTRPLLEAWQDRLVEVHMKPRSRSLATTAVRQFLKWAADHDYCDAKLQGWLVTVRLRPLQPKPIPPQDLNRLRQWYSRQIEGDGLQRLQGLRNAALFFALLGTGARVSEALQLPRAGFERVTVRQKGGTDKLLTVPESAQGYIKAYLRARHDRCPLLFVIHPGDHPMSPHAVRAVWIKDCEQLGIATFTTHAIRHTFATEMLAKGIDSRVVAGMMGHRSMQSIMGYTKVMESSRQLAMAAIDEVISAPTLVADPRILGFTKRRGRPRFQLVKGPPSGGD